MERTDKFKKQFKRLDSLLQKKVHNSIKELFSSDNPTKLGIYKKSMRVYAYNLDKSNRIIYDVDYARSTIIFIRVGDHKSSYGSD